jgi:hypothetical protein
MLPTSRADISSAFDCSGNSRSGYTIFNTCGVGRHTCLYLVAGLLDCK